MSTLLEALSDGSYDLQNKRDMSGDFVTKLLAYRNEIISEYLKYGIDLSKAISKIAQKDSLNDDQIQRIIEEVNNQVYLIKYDKLKSSTDRNVDFDIASLNKVKQCLRGESPTNEKVVNEPQEKESIKAAFEKYDIDELEKTASYNNSDTTRDIFNGRLSYSYGDLSVKTKYSESEFLLNKIAETVKTKEIELDKIAKELSSYSSEIGDMFVNLEKLGSDAGEVLSTIIKHTNLGEQEIKLLKEATEHRTAILIERKALPSDFKVNFSNMNIEKKASERLSLGKYSLSKNANVVCDTNIPSMLLLSNRNIRNIDDVVKMASEFKSSSNSLCLKNDEYINIREKCAAQGINSDMMDNDIFFQ